MSATPARAQFAASPLQWNKLLPPGTEVPHFLQNFASEDGSTPGTAQSIESRRNDIKNVGTARVWPVGIVARFNMLCKIVKEAANSIIGGAVDDNEPLMAAGMQLTTCYALLLFTPYFSSLNGSIST